MISIIVPVYNTAKYLEQVVHDLLGQDYPGNEYELIFVDNGSTDDSLRILQGFSGIQVYSEPVRGSYAARNLGIRHASGEVLAFTDSDCYPGPSWLRTIDSTFDHSQAQVVMGPRMPKTDSRSLQLIADYENTKAQVIFASNDPLVYFAYTNNMAVRRTAMDRFGPFVHRPRGSDTIFIRRVVDGISPDAVVYCPEMSVRHAELDSIGAYYGKLRTYGSSRAAYRHITKVRSLSMAERWSIFLQIARRRRFADAILLFALLCVGVACWNAGSLTGPRA